MSQKSQSDGSQKHFAVGQGLLAAAETLNFNMKDQHPGRQMGGMGSGLGMGGGSGGGDGQNTKGLMSQRGGGGNLGSTMKLFASLGLSPSDLDALAEIPEEDISVETLPHILMQLKRRKADSGDRRAASMSSDVAYQGGRDSWDEGQVGRMGASSMGQGSSRATQSTDFGFNSMQNVSSARGYGMNYSSGGDGSRERLYSGLSRQDSYGGLGMGPSQSDSVFMQRRKGSPSNGKVQDFLGVSPPMFPHVCSLCDFDVHSIMEWNQHTNGLRHAENRRMLLDMYPEWDPGMSSGRGRGVMNTANMSAGLLGPAPMSGGGAGGMSSSWGGGPGVSGQNLSGQNKLRGRVVVVKYDRKPLSNNTLFAYTKPFGRLQEHLVLKNKAFLEMSSHEEAMDMVSYYEQNPASLYGKPLNFYLSKRLLVIEKDERASERSMDRPMDRGMERPMRSMKGHDSKVVFFSNLPRDDEDKMELLTVAGRFGSVDKHLFLTDKAFVQLGTVEDAEMLVKYYSVNPLTIKGRSIRLNICTKYKTLNVKWKQGASGGDAQHQRGGRGSSATSPRARTPSTSSAHRTSSASRSSSSSRTKDEEKEKSEEKSSTVEDEEEEEVSGVVKGGEDEGAEEAEEDDDVPGGDDTEGVESMKEGESGEQEEQAPDGADSAPENVGGAETQEEMEPKSTEAEASTDEQEKKQEVNAEAAESSEPADADGSDHLADEDFMENMEDFVTLDELGEEEEEMEDDDDSIDQTKQGGMRVVNIVGFRRGYNFLDELLGLARPFGKVVRHLVLDLRPEAFVQFSTEEEARAMTKFYNSNVTASVCGRPVRVSHSMSYPTIQCGSSRVVYVGQIPSSKYSDESVLKLAKPFGKIRKYFLNRIRKECFIEMYNAEDAEKMAEEYKARPPRFNGKRLTVYVSRKYRQLKHGHHRPVSPKRENSPTPERDSDEPPSKKLKEQEEPQQEEQQQEEEEQQQQQQQEQEEQQEQQQEEHQEEQLQQEADKGGEEKTEETSAEQIVNVTKISCKEEPEEEIEINQNGQAEAPPPAPATEAKPSTASASLPLPAFDPESPVGVEYVKMGYYCRICFLFYSNEETAKKIHCSSQLHYEKLKKHLEKEQNKSEKKKLKKTATS